MALHEFGKDDVKHQTPAAHDGVDISANVEGITNDDLLAKWRTYSLEQSDTAMSEFLEELIENSRLIVIALSDAPIKADAEGHIQVDEDTEIQFPVMTTTDGKSFQPFFTDWLAVNDLYDSWNNAGLGANVERAHGLAVRFKDMVTMIEQNEDLAGAVINPFSDNITLERDAMADLAKQAAHRHSATDEDMAIEVSEAQDVPAGFWEAIEPALAQQPAVKRGWLLMMRYQDMANYFIVLDLEPIDETVRGKFFQQLADLGHAHLDEAENGLNIAAMDHDLAGVVEQITPKYTRG
ncbi:enhanced serine sensitivity protein SseB C-terminal domain-containing protein [Lacticaseibacillus yichunensis]|uniref:Enhanced serine sensitivity protein SseB C-terminal domain-containing protein n=1 Tax=Lacticaseibacillus yichunensis TaxID=2486015 RepID=A0ABW4CPK1_9LACO|nr:enhanced serine sensitivity protein SseB C-terminal domain-containing protein [Lacticaseibacillus yichunensis]